MNSEFSDLRALIIDDSPTSRMTLSSVLRDVGIQQIKGVSGPQQARMNLQDNQYDIILCEYHFGTVMTRARTCSTRSATRA
jgi:CheY-like chemotaxis protein